MKLKVWCLVESFRLYQKGGNALFCYPDMRYKPEQMVQIEVDLDFYNVQVVFDMFRVSRRVYPKK